MARRPASVRRYLRLVIAVVVALTALEDGGSLAQVPARRRARAPQPARAAYARAIEKVFALREIEALLDDRRRLDVSAREAVERVGDAITAAVGQVERAAESTGGVTRCSAELSSAIQGGMNTAVQYLRSSRESLARAAAYARAAPATAPDRLADAASAFSVRVEQKEALLRHVRGVDVSKDMCRWQFLGADSDMLDLSASFDLLHQATRDLTAQLDQLERVTLATVDAVLAARNRGWLQVDVDNATFPNVSRTRQLRLRADALEALADLRFHDPHPDAATALADYQDAVLRLVVERDAERLLQQLAQAATLDCRAEQCLELQARARDQAQAARDAYGDAESRLQSVARTIREATGLGVFATDASAWRAALTAVVRSFDVARPEIDGVLDDAGRTASDLEDPVRAALQQALRERRQAYVDVFKSPEPEEDVPTSLVIPPRVPADVVAAVGAAPGPVLTRHAFEVLALRSQEPPDYGAYTYVIFPRREPRPEYQALLEAIVALTPVADPNAPLEIKRSTNLFEIPGRSARVIEPEEAPAYARDIDNYDFSRALSLVQTASDGVLTAPRVLRRFQRSPGPFLLTLPVPIHQARGVTHLLLADLSGYPTAGLQDLVKSYQNDLVGAFPTTQRVWAPPWNQRIALGLLSIGVLTTGQNFVALR